MKGERNMTKTYTTIAGDMWDSIAYKTLGDCYLMDSLIKANMQYREMFIFPAGVEIAIPEVSIERKFTLPPWKRSDNQ